jgi:hypothetical protein
VKSSTLQAFIVVTCLTAILLILPTTIASTGWTRTYQGEPLDILTPASLVQASDGGFATAIFAYARRIDNIGFQGHFTESYELQIIKTTSNGEVQWRQNFTKIDDPNHETPSLLVYSKPHIIVQTSDQGYAIASSGTDNFWIFKIDSQGKILWTKAYAHDDENPSSSSLYSMIQTNDGGFALAGSTETSQGGNDFWLLKTDSRGKAQWNQTYNSGTYKDSWGNENPRQDEAKNVIQTRDGGYALAGSASLYRASTSSVVYASWMVKTDAQGKHVWNKGYDSPNDPGREYCIIQTTDDGYAITGTQNDDFYLMKIDATSQMQWGKTYGDTGTDMPCALVQLTDGGYAIAGTWTKINTTATVSTTGLLRLDSSGQTIWTKTYNAKQNATNISRDQANSMIRTSDGSYAITGSTTFGNEYHQDVFLVKTETLEQPFQPTPAPTPAPPEPTITPKPTLTSEPTSNPTQQTTTRSPEANQSRSPSPSNPPTQPPTFEPTPSQMPSPSIPELSTWILLPICAGIIVLLAAAKKHRKF